MLILIYYVLLYGLIIVVMIDATAGQPLQKLAVVDNRNNDPSSGLVAFHQPQVVFVFKL